MIIDVSATADDLQQAGERFVQVCEGRGGVPRARGLLLMHSTLRSDPSLVLAEQLRLSPAVRFMGYVSGSFRGLYSAVSAPIFAIRH